MKGGGQEEVDRRRWTGGGGQEEVDRRRGTGGGGQEEVDRRMWTGGGGGRERKRGDRTNEKEGDTMGVTKKDEERE